MYYLYIIQSLKDQKFYTGITGNVEKRLSYHNKGLVRSTKNRVPFKIVYTEECSDRVSAREREKYFKSYEGSREKMNILDKFK